MKRLTRKQSEVMDLVVEGETNKGIAYKLNRHEKTVEKHLHNIYETYQVENRTQAALRYEEHKRRR